MGTEYILDDEGKLEIGESSSTLTLYHTIPNELTDIVFEDMEPCGLMRLFLKGITVCSYHMTKEEFKQTMEKHFENWSI